MCVVPYQNFLIVFLFLFIGSCSCFAQEHDPITIHLIGDSTMADYSDNYDPGKDYMQTRYPLTGWGQVFQALFTKKSVTLLSNLIQGDSVVVSNKARGGRSTRTFFQQGHWAEVYKAIKPNDLVMMQFGHNDASKSKPERYVNVRGYKEFLRLFVTQTRQKGGIPIILTPVPRNYPWEKGILKDVHKEYDSAPKDVAQEMGVLLIDLNTLARDFFTKKGKSYVSKHYYMNLPPNTFKAYPKGENDNTHFQVEGAAVVAQIVFDALIELSQHSPKPYTIATTYEKLKKDYPHIQPLTLVNNPSCITIKDIPYRQTKQQTLRADVFIPNSGKGQYGSVLLVHGGGWISGSKENLKPLAQRLAENGYVAVSVNYSLSTVAQFPAAVIDLKAAIKWMRAHSNEFKIDPERIAILGASAGAQLATLVGVSASNPMFFDGNKEFKDKVQGVINIDGITSFIHPDARESEIAGKWLGGLQDENFNNWRLASALEYVDNNSPPILFVNSSQDRFHAGRDDMISKLNSYQIYSEVHTLQQSPHSFWLVHPWFQPTLNHCLEFLDKIW